MGRFLIFIAFAFLCGIALGRYYFPMAGVVIVLCGALIWAVINYLQRREGLGAFLPVLIVFLVAGNMAYSFALQKIEGSVREFAGVRCTLTGMIADEPLRRDDEVIFPLRPEYVKIRGEEFPVTGLVRVTLRLDAPVRSEEAGGGSGDSEPLSFLTYGRQVSLQGVIETPQGQRNPGGFDYRSFLETQGQSAVFYGSITGVVDGGISGNLSWMHQSALRLKQRLISTLEAYLPQREGGLLTGMLFGDRERLDPDTELAFRRCGVAHLLAVSGLHTGLVAAFLFFIFRRIGLKDKGWLLFFLIAAFLFVYVYLTGLKPAALRAYLMILIGLLALCLDREQDLPITLAAACLLTLIYNPLLLFNVGFQFSYGAMASIIVLAPRWKEVFYDWLCLPAFSFFPWPKQLASLAAITFAAQLGVLPFSAYYFGEISLVGIAVNLIILPLMALVLGIGLFAALLGLLFPAAGSLASLASYPLLAYMAVTTEFIGAFRYAAMTLFPPRNWEIALYYVLLLSPGFTDKLLSPSSLKQGAGDFKSSLTAALSSTFSVAQPEPASAAVNDNDAGSFHSYTSRRRVINGTTVLLLFFLFFLWCGGGIRLPGQLEVTFLDVGQGDAIHIRTPQGRHILLDGGGRPSYLPGRADPGERVLFPYMQHKRIRKLDAVIVSHSHDDHFGGLTALLERTPALLLLTPSEEGESEFYSNFLAMIEEKNIPRENLYAGDKLIIEPSLELSVLNPPESLFFGTVSDVNNNSLVLQLNYKKASFLFTGDIQSRAAADLIRKDASLQSGILKIPHHGGYLQEMPQFLDEVDPFMVVITVGKNSFGHPNPATLAALEERNIKVYRTDLHGAVIMRTDGVSLRVQTMY